MRQRCRDRRAANRMDIARFPFLAMLNREQLQELLCGSVADVKVSSLSLTSPQLSPLERQVAARYIQRNTAR